MTFSFSDIQNNPNQVLIDPVIPATAPGDGQGFLGRYSKPFKEGLSSLGQSVSKIVSNVGESASKTAAQVRPALSKRAGTIGTAAGVGTTVTTQMAQNQPLGAVVGGIGSVAGGLIGARFGGQSGLGRAIGGGIGSLVGGLAGEGVEQVKAAVTGAGKGNAPGGTEAPAYIPGTNIPMNDAARYMQLQGAINQQQVGNYKSMMGVDVAAQKDILQHTLNAQVQQSKALMPLIEQSKNNDQVRTQSLMNTAGNIDARLGIVANQGALAKGAQAEAGALARTFAGSNPYAQFAVRQSPNIQFG